MTKIKCLNYQKLFKVINKFMASKTLGGAIPRKAGIQHVNRNFHSPAPRQNKGIQYRGLRRILLPKTSCTIVNNYNDINRQTSESDDLSICILECMNEDDVFQNSPFNFIIPCHSALPSCQVCGTPVSWEHLAKNSFTLSIGKGAVLSLCPECNDKTFFTIN